MKNSLFEMSWNTDFFQAINSLDDYIPLSKGDVTSSINEAKRNEIFLKRHEAISKGEIPPDQFLRASHGKWIAGVCMGMENTYGIPVWLTRVLFVAFTGFVFTPFAYLLIALSFKEEQDVFHAG